MEKKIILVGDIISSTKIDSEDRISLQKKLMEVLNKLNYEDEHLISPYKIAFGDEFQAVFNKANDIFKNIFFILESLFPEKARFSIGIGAIDSPIDKQTPLKMYGPAFYSARKGMDELKKNRHLYIIKGKNVLNMEFINQVLYLISYISLKWERKDLQILCMLLDEEPVKIISKKTKIPSKTVYRRIYTRRLRNIIKLFNEITLLLNKSLIDTCI
ncbi:SatD family protein [candidate division KSB1 bacterium]